MSKSKSGGSLWLCLSLLVGLLGGCATTEQAAETGDPIEPWNRGVYDFNDTLDRNLIGPIADGYVAITPEPARTAITNFFDNIGTPWSIINAVGQGKILEAFEGVGRFMVNTVLGLGGLIDMATGFGIERYDEDLGQTLAVWGVPEGPYLMLPVLGPSTGRDAPDWVARYFMPTPVDALTDAGRLGANVLQGVNKRANLSGAIRVRDRSALDPYVFTREAYRQQRLYVIHDGDPPVEGFDTPQQ